MAEQMTEAEQDNMEELVNATKDKILHLLETFPYISRSMIQTGLSPALPPKLWGPILDKAVEQGEIKLVEVATTNPSGRALTKGVYHLPHYAYPPEKQLLPQDLSKVEEGTY